MTSSMSTDEVKALGSLLQSQGFHVADTFLAGEMIDTCRTGQSVWMSCAYQETKLAESGPKSMWDASGGYASYVGFFKYVGHDGKSHIGLYKTTRDGHIVYVIPDADAKGNPISPM